MGPAGCACKRPEEAGADCDALWPWMNASHEPSMTWRGADTHDCMRAALLRSATGPFREPAPALDPGHHRPTLPARCVHTQTTVPPPPAARPAPSAVRLAAALATCQSRMHASTLANRRGSHVHAAQQTADACVVDCRHAKDRMGVDLGALGWASQHSAAGSVIRVVTVACCTWNTPIRMAACCAACMCTPAPPTASAA